MRKLIAALAGTMVFSLAIPASAQDRGGVSTKDIIGPQLVPAPENGDIIVRFGDATRVYFKQPIKSVRLEDEYSVRAVPQSDHIVEFTGLAPGRSRLTIELRDGGSSSFGLVTVVREPHEVRVYKPGQINQVTGERRSDSASAIGGYVSQQCNEIRCDEQEPALAPSLPKIR